MYQATPSVGEMPNGHFSTHNKRLKEALVAYAKYELKSIGVRPDPEPRNGDYSADIDFYLSHKDKENAEGLVLTIHKSAIDETHLHEEAVSMTDDLTVFKLFLGKYGQLTLVNND